MGIGGLLISKQAARTGEVVVWKTNANRLQGRRALGGRLYLTNQRVLFSPHLLDATTGGRAWAVDLSDVKAIEREKRNFSRPLSRPRSLLRIETSDGKHELFVVNRLDEAIGRLCSAAETRSPAPGREAG